MSHYDELKAEAYFIIQKGDSNWALIRNLLLECEHLNRRIEALEDAMNPQDAANVQPESR